MRLSRLLGVIFVLSSAQSWAGTYSARQTFADALAAAYVAERNCDIPDEVERAFRWINRFRSGFDTLQNREDSALVYATLARVETQLRRSGKQVWCVEYRARRNFSPYVY